MTAYSVFQNPNPGTSEAVPFLLDVQSELLSSLNTRVVVPLYRTQASRVQPIAHLTPQVSFQGQSLVAMVPEMAGMSRRDMGAPVGELVSARSAMLQAIDLLLTGF